MKAIYVYKEQRLLQLFGSGRIILSCGIGLGASPVGHKTHEGDGKTPQGRYIVCTRNAESKYMLFLGLNYPGLSDAQRAYEGGLILKAQRDAIKAAHESGLRPPWDTPLGGQIGIHGGGIDISGTLIDSTAGCIALRDADILALWPLSPIGTPVIILP